MGAGLFSSILLADHSRLWVEAHCSWRNAREKQSRSNLGGWLFRWGARKPTRLTALWKLLGAFAIGPVPPALPALADVPLLTLAYDSRTAITTSELRRGTRTDQIRPRDHGATPLPNQVVPVRRCCTAHVSVALSGGARRGEAPKQEGPVHFGGLPNRHAQIGMTMNGSFREQTALLVCSFGVSVCA
ncbi:hypothetical protein CALVIDRAFT_333537 [Calocera viscosa TUFC12733]|uniref:Uncharacterized protein n=1 Tax=Calocera viscosa (strain TUFC12733) TaxID=1330018 RepID=A0A167HL41_CALVF|nr:hypothetical protein CALVIDRAFT_333537 [Calocera viscosa TUFC12733]